MSKKLVLRTAKLSSQTQKVKSTNNICISYEHSPSDPEERRHGVLFAVIGLQGDPKKSENLIELILETFHGEYYQDIEKAPLTSFENALNKINEELGDYTNGGNTYWMGKLNAILGVFADNILHLTQAGNTEGFLYRNGKQSDITKDLKGDNLNPLRTFINIASGEVIEGDKVAIMSSGILNSASPNELSEYIIKYHPKVSVSNLADLIAGAGGSRGQNGAVIIEFMSPDALANETLDDEPDEIWLEETKKEKAGKYGLALLDKLTVFFRSSYRIIKKFIISSCIPLASKAVTSIRDQIANIKEEEKPTGKVLLETKESLFTNEDPEELASKTPNSDKTSAKSNSYKSEIRIKEGDDFPNISKIEQKKQNVISKIGNFIDTIRRFFLEHTRRKRFTFFKKIKKNYYLYAGILIILILIPYFYINNKNNAKADEQAKEKARIEQLDERFQEAINAAGTDKGQAIEILTAIQGEYESLKNSSYSQEAANQKLSQIEAEINRLTNTKSISLQTFADFSEISENDFLDFYKVENEYYGVSKAGKIFKHSADGKISQVQITGSITGNVISTTLLARIRTIEILTDTPTVFEIDLDTNIAQEKAASDGWETSVAIDSYGTNLYLLSKNPAQIFKHLRTASGYGKGAAQISNSEALQEPLDLTIDSDVYILNDSGEILKFTSGIRQEFQIKDMPFNLKDYGSIVTAADYDNLFVFSKKLKSLVVLDKDGSYRGRFTGDELGEAESILIDGTDLYLTSAKKVYSFQIN